VKTIELKNQQDWFIIHDNENEKTRYIFSDEIYSNLESIIIVANFSLDYPLLQGSLLNAPNLKLLGFRDEGCKKCIQNLNENGFLAPLIETIGFENIGITQIPEFIFKLKTIKDIHFRQEKLEELPSGLFDLTNLKTLRFQFGSQIPIIPDAIKNLVNLEEFDFWGATVDYLSPELFRLPKINYINFTESRYKPTEDVLDAVKEFKMNDSNIFFGWCEY